MSTAPRSKNPILKYIIVYACNIRKYTSKGFLLDFRRRHRRRRLSLSLLLPVLLPVALPVPPPQPPPFPFHVLGLCQSP